MFRIMAKSFGQVFFPPHCCHKASLLAGSYLQIEHFILLDVENTGLNILLSGVVFV